MGQAASSSAGIPSPAERREIHHRRRHNKLSMNYPQIYSDAEEETTSLDYISNLPDECLACIFQTLGSGDRKRCSLVCRRWLRVEGQSRHRLSLNAKGDLLSAAPSLFTRFDSVSKLALKCDRKAVSINDDGLILISTHCKNLTRLKLRACRELTDAGMEGFAENCRWLKKLSCDSCTFGVRGMNSVLKHCSVLEELSVKRLRGLTDGSAETIGTGIGASGSVSSLKTICLKELYNGQIFGPLIIGSKNLRTLKLFRCIGDWDKILELVTDQVTGLNEVHLERLQVSDRGLMALSACSDLEILHLVKTPECTNTGLAAVADRCKLLRKLHIDGWKTNRIGDEGLVAVAKRSHNLQELVLIGVNPTSLSLGLLASNCRNLERLALCGSETIGDAEICCIAAKCLSLKKLCIKGCPVSDQGMGALAGGCPNLVKVKVKKCKLVTSEGADRLRANRGSLAVNLDASLCEAQDTSASDGAQENGVQLLSVASNVHQFGTPFTSNAGGNGGHHRAAFFKARLGFFSGRSFVACTFRRWSTSNPHNI